MKLGDDNAMKWVCSSYDAAGPLIQTKETMDRFESFYKLFRLSFTNEKTRNAMSIQLSGRVNLLLTRAQSNISGITLDRQMDLFEIKGSQRKKLEKYVAERRPRVVFDQLNQCHAYGIQLSNPSVTQHLIRLRFICFLLKVVT